MISSLVKRWIAICFVAIAPIATVAEPLRIGVILTLSGDGIDTSEDMQLALKLFPLDRDKKIEFIVEDDYGDPGTALQAAKTLIGKGAHALIGPTKKLSAIALAGIVSKERIALISLSDHPALTDKPELRSPFYYRLGTTEGHLQNFANKFMRDKLRAKKIAVVAPEAVFVHGSTPQDALPGLSATWIKDIDQIGSALQDPADAAYVGSPFPNGQPVVAIPKLRRAGIGTIVISRPSGGIRSLAGINDPKSYVVSIMGDYHSAGKKLYADFRAAHNYAPLGGNAARAYSAAQVIKLAADRIEFWGSRGPGTKEALAAAIGQGTFQTVLGPVKLRSGEGCTSLPLFIMGLDRHLTVAASVEGNPCNCNEKGCCDECCKNQKIACEKDKTCSSTS